MADQGEQYELSWILHHVLDTYIGSREILAVRRNMVLVGEKTQLRDKETTHFFRTGSSAEGMRMEGSDLDMMSIEQNVIVLSPDQYLSIPPDCSHKVVFMMRDNVSSRPGYVTLELVNQKQTYQSLCEKSIVVVGRELFISSEIHKQLVYEKFSVGRQGKSTIHGPAATTKWKLATCSNDVDVDFVGSLPCPSWPKEANEWVSRPRLHEWPDRALRDEIVQGGCHLVPVGDRTSPDTFLQWRISFAVAERKLIYSLTHTQFLIDGLLKYFLKQISKRLDQELGEADIISSYIIKTVIFHAVESTDNSLWREGNTFLCFMLCLNILIAWVKAGHCPNYFIKSNNMFSGKVHGEQQEKLLHILTDFRDMKWGCLSYGNFIQPSIGAQIQRVRDGEWEYALPSPTWSEKECDMELFITALNKGLSIDGDSLPTYLRLLYESKMDTEGFIYYVGATYALSCRGLDAFEKYVAAKGNKEKYKCLHRCKRLLIPLSSVCTSPGQLLLATYYYQTGNYRKTLELCGNMISSFKIRVAGFSSLRDLKKYEHLYMWTWIHRVTQMSGGFCNIYVVSSTGL